MKKRAQVFYSGSVQGVGFRFTAEHLARRFPVTGFVRNLSTGEVELVIEGEEASVKEFLKEIQESFRSHIREARVTWQDATGEFKSFGIRF